MREAKNPQLEMAKQPQIQRRTQTNMSLFHFISLAAEQFGHCNRRQAAVCCPKSEPKWRQRGENLLGNLCFLYKLSLTGIPRRHLSSGFESKIVDSKWRWGMPVRLRGRVTKQVFNGRVSWCKCTRPFGVILPQSWDNKLMPLGVGCNGRIARRLMRWNETRTYWLGFGIGFVAAWPFQAEDFSPLASGIPNWTVKPCPFSYSGNSGLKEIA